MCDLELGMTAPSFDVVLQPEFRLCIHVVGRTLPSDVGGRSLGAARCHERSTGRGYDRYPAWTGPWLRLDLGLVRYRECRFHRSSQPMVAIFLDVTGARATAVGLRVTPSRLVSPARCCCGFFGLPPICTSPQSVFDVP